VGEPDDQEASRQRAERLREQIEELRQNGSAPSRPLSPREFTDDAAREESGKATDDES
jgi:cell division protein FtsB